MTNQIIKGPGTKNLGIITLKIGSVRIGDAAEDGFVDFTPVNDLGEVTWGGLGRASFSVDRRNGMQAVLKFTEHAKAYRQVAELMNAQRDQPIILPLPFLYFDPANGDRVSDTHTFFMNVPNISGSRVTGTREFRIILPNARANAKFGSLNFQ